MSGSSPSTDLVHINRNDIIKSGWLSKQSRYFKEWRLRWFVLTSEFLCSFEDQNSLLQNRKPTEVLRLRDCSTVKSADEITQKPNVFRVDTPYRVFYLSADTYVDKEAWIGHIGRQMVRPTVFTNNGEDGSPAQM